MYELVIGFGFWAKKTVASCGKVGGSKEMLRVAAPRPQRLQFLRRRLFQLPIRVGPGRFRRRSRGGSQSSWRLRAAEPRISPSRTHTSLTMCGMRSGRARRQTSFSTRHPRLPSHARRSMTEAHCWCRGRHLAIMTISGHNRRMKAVRIAELKSRLSEYLRAVRNGETISVLDRETPVAQIVPVRERVALRIRKPAPGTPPPNRVRLPKPLKLDVDIVDLLLEERQGHR